MFLLPSHIWGATKPPRRYYATAAQSSHARVELDLDIVDHFKAMGDDWQARINDLLRKAKGL
ncbi:BrnA antitoxin family protein [Rhizobium mongolense]|uniref:BrnA antitoxin family protein n=1 Tax=Rhizobium mongolense TaxID=57676 RepID=UPI0034A2BE21